MLFNINKEKIDYIPHKKDYDVWRSRLTDDQHLQIMVEMEKALNGKEVLVSSFIPGNDWDYPYYYIYEACDEDYQNAAYFFGLLMWEAVIRSNDSWCFLKYNDDKKNIKGMTYFRIQL